MAKFDVECCQRHFVFPREHKCRQILFAKLLANRFLMTIASAVKSVGPVVTSSRSESRPGSQQNLASTFHKIEILQYFSQTGFLCQGWIGSILGSFPIVLHAKLPSIDPPRPVKYIWRSRTLRHHGLNRTAGIIGDSLCLLKDTFPSSKFKIQLKS